MKKNDTISLGCGTKPIDLSAMFLNHKHLLNIRNKNNYCALYVIAAYFVGKKATKPDDPYDEVYRNFIISNLYIQGNISF